MTEKRFTYTKGMRQYVTRKGLQSLKYYIVKIHNKFKKNSLFVMNTCNLLIVYSIFEFVEHVSKV